MSKGLSVSEDVQSIVEHIIEKYNLDPKADVSYGVGSESGDGFLSKTIAVDILDDKESLSLFIKYALNASMGTMSLDKVYANEIYFYDTIYPEFRKFEEEKNVEDPFKNVPKCYATSTKNVIALENLKKIGFELFEKTNSMNENHIIAVFKAFAKYHAISFAFKDQNKEKYQALSDKCVDFFNNMNSDGNLQEMQKNILNTFLKKLDVIEDKHILNVCTNLHQNLVSYSKAFGAFKDQYSVITKGDCWSNNIMFRYKEEDKESPSDVMLIDWQIVKEGSATLDLSYFFYTVASKEELKKLDHYMRFYHKELSKHINKLGSDAEVLYPYSVFEGEWRKHCKFAYSMAILIFNVILMEKDEVPDFEKVDASESTRSKAFESEMKPEYFRRLKNLTEHFVENNYI